MSDFILQIRVYDYMHIVANMTNDFFIVLRRFLYKFFYLKALTHDFAIFKNNKYIYIQIFLVSKCNFIRNIYMKRATALAYIFFLSKMNWALIVIITERNQKDFLDNQRPDSAMACCLDNKID